MKKRIILYLSYLLFWLLYFIISKYIFLFFNFSLSRNISFADWFLIPIHGFRLDFATVGYHMLLPGILICFTAYFNNKILSHILNIYTAIILFINVFLLVSDLELFTHWKYRMDCTPLLYLGNPKEVFGSVEVSVIIRQILFGVILFAAFFISYIKLIAKKIRFLDKTNWLTMLVFLLITGISFIQMRGGFGIVPINISSAYYHTNPFVNQASINLFWNVGHSYTESADLKNDYIFMEQEKADALFSELYKKEENKKQILREKPNVIILLLESFTAKVIKAVGGRDSITPNLNRIAHEGILFDNFYASGDRSDKGIAAIISGFPAQPKTSIMKYPGKTQKLPFLSNILKKENYSTAFYYGGDPDFANIKTYLLNGGFDKIISKNDFDPKNFNAKWGVHDHIVLNRLLADLDKSNTPFFNMLFTLSSHNPFDVPMEKKIQGDDDDSKFLNSVFYTDKCIGEFITKAKTKPWWNNTLIIIVADHGSLQPDNTNHFAIASFKIPMIWIGGAVIPKDSAVHTYSSQTDIATTLLNQMEIKCDDFKYGKNIFNDPDPSFAFYAFNNGFGFIEKDANLIFDNNAQTFILNNGPNTKRYEPYSKAFLQVLLDDFIKK